MYLDVETVHRRLDPMGIDRASYDKAKKDAAESSPAPKDLVEVFNKLFGVGSPDQDAKEEEEEVFDLDPLGRALAKLLVQKQILTEEEVEETLDKILDEDEQD